MSLILGIVIAAIMVVMYALGFIAGYFYRDNKAGKDGKK
jgi:hypothetical protein